MDDKKRLALEHRDLIEVLFHLAKGQEILAQTISRIGEVDMDSRVTNRAREGVEEWEKEMHHVSGALSELRKLLP